MRIGWLASLWLATATFVWGGVDEGRQLYEKQCIFCHSIAGKGGRLAETGGPLDGVGTKRDAAWLRKYLHDPRSALPNAKMPKMRFSDAQLGDLVAFMLTLKEPAAAK
jgi:mono/diheme cytochrome c family protein